MRLRARSGILGAGGTAPRFAARKKDSPGAGVHARSRAIPDRRDVGRRRDGARLQGLRPEDRPHARHQGAQVAPPRRRRIPRALPARGERRRNPVAPEHRHGVRRGRGGPPALHRDGMGRRADALRPDEGRKDLHAAADRRDRHPARARARLRAQERHRPPRREARQHHAGPRHAHGEGRRLRHLPDQRDRADAEGRSDADGRGAGNAQLHVARAGPGPSRRRALGSLFGGRRALPDADRAPAVRGRLDDQRRLQDRQHRRADARRAAARPAAVAAPRDRAGAEESAREALSIGRSNSRRR